MALLDLEGLARMIEWMRKNLLYLAAVGAYCAGQVWMAIAGV